MQLFCEILRNLKRLYLQETKFVAKKGNIQQNAD